MRSYQHLSGEDREEIAVLRAAGSVAFALYPSHRHWTCREKVPATYLIHAACRSKRSGLSSRISSDGQEVGSRFVAAATFTRCCGRR